MERASRYEDTLGYFSKALREINENPTNHGYAPEEVERLRKIESDIILPTQAALIKAQKTAEIFTKGIEAFIKIANLQTDILFSNFKHASKGGWYISPNVVSECNTDEVMEMFDGENLELFEKRILSDSKSTIPSIISRCSNSFPQRAHIFKEIEQLFKKKFYYATVNLCYSQADGICNDAWDISFFDKDRTSSYELRLYQVFKELDEGVAALIKDQLNIDTNEITQNSKHDFFQITENKKKSFNRHLVLHGHSTEYGNKLNALRAIFLLDFIEYFYSKVDF